MDYIAVEAVRDCEARWRGLIPADYGEHVHRVAARFAILEAALLLGEVITGWDVIQHSYNRMVTGVRDEQQGAPANH